MIPTNYLRYDRSNAAKYDESPPTLQQWWVRDVESIYLEPLIHCGEWRDVPTVEGA